MPERRRRRVLVLAATGAMAFALSAAGCETSGRDLPAPTTTAVGPAFVTPSSIAPTIPPTTTR